MFKVGDRVELDGEWTVVEAGAASCLVQNRKGVNDRIWNSSLIKTLDPEIRVPQELAGIVVKLIDELMDTAVGSETLSPERLNDLRIAANKLKRGNSDESQR